MPGGRWAHCGDAAAGGDVNDIDGGQIVADDLAENILSNVSLLRAHGLAPRVPDRKGVM